MNRAFWSYIPLLFILGIVGSLFWQQQSVGILQSSGDVTGQNVGQIKMAVPLYFEPNQGQFNEAVDYMVRASGYRMYLTRASEVFWVLEAPVDTPADTTANGQMSTERRAMLRMSLVNASGDQAAQAQNLQPGRLNYFRGNDPQQWRRNIPTYGRVHYQQVYPGVDVEYYGSKDGRLEYDFVVAPGVDASVIRLQFEGAEGLHIDEQGNLVLSTQVGKLVHKKPFAYQMVDGRQNGVEAHYHIEGEQVYFQVASYDASRPLIIDPILSYSSYLGGSENDKANAVAVDGEGNIYITGQTFSSNFPINITASGGPSENSEKDVFVSKFDKDGQLLFTTFIGMVGKNDGGNDIALDVDRNIYVTGLAATDKITPGFPTTTDAYSKCDSGWVYDAFMTKLSSDGNLLYSTCLGGSRGDEGRGIATDGLGGVYIAGVTLSNDLPVKAAYQGSFGGDIAVSHNDAFVAYLRPLSLKDNDLVFSTYLGGSTWDEGNAIALMPDGSVIITGLTASKDFPASLNGFHDPVSGVGSGIYDAFVAKMTADGSGLEFSVYLGGSDYDDWNSGLQFWDEGLDVAADSNGYIYVAGRAGSSDFLEIDQTATFSQIGVLQGYTDAFLTQLDSEGNIIYSTYLGGSADDEGRGVAVDNAGDVYIGGWTTSVDFPLAVNAAIQEDAFVTQFNGNNMSAGPVNSVLYGGDGDDRAHGIAVDDDAAVYLVGETSSLNNLPVTQNALQDVLAGGVDAFVARLTLAVDLDVVITGSDAGVGENVTYTFDITNNGPDTATGIVLTIELPAGVTYVSNDFSCAFVSGVGVCSVSDLGPGGSVATVTVQVQLDVSTAVTTTATVTANEADVDLQNNLDSIETIASLPESPGSGSTVPTITINDSNVVASVESAGGGGVFDFWFMATALFFIVSFRRRWLSVL